MLRNQFSLIGCIEIEHNSYMLPVNMGHHGSPDDVPIRIGFENSKIDPFLYTNYILNVINVNSFELIALLNIKLHSWHVLKNFTTAFAIGSDSSTRKTQIIVKRNVYLSLLRQPVAAR